MRIGFDAKWYFNGNPSGRIVVRNLLKEFIAINTEHEIYVILNKKDYDKNFPFENDKVKLIYVWSGINLLSNIIVVPIIISKYKLDVCVFQYFAPIFGSFKKIVYIHDVIFKAHPEFFTLKERIYFSPMKFFARWADAIITVSEFEKKRIKQFHFLGRKTKIRVIYNGVNKKFKSKKHFKSKELEMLESKYNLPERFLLYVGRLNERKNILNLLKSIKYLKDEEIKLVLGGTYDWKMFNLQQKIEELNLNERVLVLGYINDNELPMLYSLAYVFCYVSFEEGFGLPPLESLASGVPVVVSNTSSLPEVCGEAGTYCNPFDSVDIANKIKMLLEDNALYAVKKQLGLEQANKFSWKLSAEKLLSVCEKTVLKNVK